MALQTQTFSLGDFAKANGSNGYILDLIVTEESTDMAANTSLISYTLQLRSGSSNRFQDQLWASVSIAGSVVKTLDNHQIYAYYNHTYSLISGSTIVGHNADGTLNLAVEGKIWVPDVNQYAPPDMTVTGTLALTQIPRVSQVSISPAIVEAGGVLTIYTNRKSDAFTHNLRYRFGNMSGMIKEGVGASCPWTVPPELASQIPATDTGWGTIRCDTYLNGTLIGTSRTDFAVHVSENDTTKPKISVELSPVGNVPEAFAGMYIQGKTKVRAVMTAEPWYSYINNYAMLVNGVYYSGNTTLDSDVLKLPVSMQVTCEATDARGFNGYWVQHINVLPYGKPTVAPHPDTGSVICCRCDVHGNPNINGTHILVKAGRSWYGLEGKNLCRLQWRCREENGGWGQWQPLLERTATENQVSTVLPVELETKTAYMIQLGVVDDMGEEGVLDCPIGTANTPFHLGRGGRNVGLGRYCDYSHQDAIDAGWPIYMGSNPLRELPNPTESADAANKEYVDGSVGNATIRQVYLGGTNRFTIQSEFGDFNGNGGSRQSVFLFGLANGLLIYGLIFINNGGGVNWGGTENVTVTAGSGGQVTVTLATTAWDHFLLMSPEPFSIV